MYSLLMSLCLFAQGPVQQPAPSIVPEPNESAWKAGAVTLDITPPVPLPLSGYHSRGNRPFVDVAQPLRARVLVLQWQSDRPVVFITVDLLGVPTAFTAAVKEDIARSFDIPADRVVIVASHTHSGPAIHEQFKTMLGFTEGQSRAIDQYVQHLERLLVGGVNAAMRTARAATLWYGEGTCRFAMNRRERRGDQIVLGVNPDGPVDHSVPVLWVRDATDGRPLAVLFGYACHCTTLGGDFFRICGDYAGYAQDTLEQRFPGLVPCFVTGCGGDANPYPRGTLALAREHGQSLARAVEATLADSLRLVCGPVYSKQSVIALAFSNAPPLEEFERRARTLSGWPGGHARWILEMARRNGGKLPETYPYQLQAFQFGNDLTFLAMAGEVVVEYGLNLKRRFLRPDGPPLWVAAYANDVFAYIPTARMLEEGGYEPVHSMAAWGWHTTWDRSVEERVLDAAAALIEAVRELHRAAVPDTTQHQRATE